MASRLDIKYLHSTDGKPVAVDVAERDSNGNIIKDTYINKDGSNSLTANLDLNNHKIINLTSPDNDTDAVNKSYVDTNIKNISETESTAREELSSNFQKLLNNEITNRTTGDNTLDTKITNLTTSLGSEISNREVADTNLQDQITKNKTDIDSLKTTKSDITYVDEKIISEAKTREEMDSSTLSTAKGYTDEVISTETTRAEGVETELRNLITTETTTRQSNEQTLSSRITTIESTISSGDSQTLASLVFDEI